MADTRKIYVPFGMAIGESKVVEKSKQEGYVIVETYKDVMTMQTIVIMEKEDGEV